MNATILSIGDELILGQTIDTNSAWLSTQLATVGIAARAHVTVSDDQQSIERAIRESSEVSDVLLVTGGLGPTQDDLTRQALASVMNVELVMDEVWRAEMTRMFTTRGRPMPQSNLIQAMIPIGAERIDNTTGTAAGIKATLKTSGESCQVFIMPGVPREMKAMFSRDIFPLLEAAGAGAILSRTLHTFGMGESSVAERLGDLMDRHRNPSVGTTVSGGGVSLRINSRFDQRDRAASELQATVLACHEALGDLIYGQDEQTLAGEVMRLLQSHGRTVATAESCTGGLLSTMLTDVPGSSAVFQYGWVTYSNRAKQDLLGVSEALLQAHGAVSLEAVEAMSRQARIHAGADYALAISGIAGPDGGTPTKPVGTVCIALASAGGVTARSFRLSGDRQMIRDRSAKTALTMLRYVLLDKPMPSWLV